MSPSNTRIRPKSALRFGMIAAACLALATVYAVPPAANATYDPKHGRWLQRDPLGVRPDPAGGRLEAGTQYIDGVSLYQYVRSSPTNLVDPRANYGADIHKHMTVSWATQEGMRGTAAMWVGESNIKTDGGMLMGGTGPMPYGEPGRHFDRNPSGFDSRGEYKANEYVSAVHACLGHDTPEEAAQHLGRSLHSLQDRWAHGEYWSAKGTPGKIWAFHDMRYDNMYMDAVGPKAYGVAPPADGRPPQVFETVRTWGILWTRTREVSWPHWSPGTKRAKGTEDASRVVIHAFLKSIDAGKCPKCRCRFIDRKHPNWSRD